MSESLLNNDFRIVVEKTYYNPKKEKMVILKENNVQEITGGEAKKKWKKKFD